MKNKSFLKHFKKNISGFRKIIPQVLMYQIITKLLLATLILPLYRFITKLILETSGFSAVSNDDLIGFILSPPGLLYLILGLIFILLIMVLEIFGFVTISSRSIKGQAEVSYIELIKNNFQNLSKFKDYGGIIILLYLLVLVPISGMGLSITPGKYVKIPNFISSVIISKGSYLAIYVVLVIIIGILTFLWGTTFHFILIGGNKAKDAIKNSTKLMIKSAKLYFNRFIPLSLFVGAIALVIIIFWILLIGFLYIQFDFLSSGGRVVVVAFLLLQVAAVSIAGLLIIPFEIYLLTDFFYEATGTLNEFNWVTDKYQVLHEKTKQSIPDKIFKYKKTITALILLLIIGVSIPIGMYISDNVITPNKIQVIGHRGGWGEGKPENSIEAMEESIKNKADFVEVDVQRTQDGFYILNHDNSFLRVAGVNRTAQEMDLKEIKSLDIGIKFGEAYKGMKVPTVEELFKASKGRIGVYLELKGKSADTKMADDMVKLIKSMGMEKEVVLMSLSGDLINYIESLYPEMQTGFTYFFAMGKLDQFESDVMVIEEEVATPKNIEAIHNSKKKVAVWTVNTRESMEKFSESDVDSIITDNVKDLMEILAERNLKSGSDILFGEFFKQFTK